MINLINKQIEGPSYAYEEVFKKLLDAVVQTCIRAGFEELAELEPVVNLEWLSAVDMQIVNRESRGVDRVTDVLSFPLLDMFNGKPVGPLQPGDILPAEILSAAAEACSPDEVEQPGLGKPHHLETTADSLDFKPSPDSQPDLCLQLGDILICTERMQEQAEQYGHSEQREAAFLFLHGLLHLCGYDHLEEADRLLMEAAQDEILESLGIGRELTGDRVTSEPNLLSGHSSGLGQVDRREGEAPFRSGFVALVGRTNAGKSTLLNDLSGMKLAIVSRKSQTTRHAIRAIVNRPDAQYIFVDTPGIYEPQDRLGEQMMTSVRDSLDDADVICLLVDAGKRNITGVERAVFDRARAADVPVVLALNKTDAMAKEKLLPLLQLYFEQFEPAAMVPISALSGDGVEELLQEIYRFLPEGPRYYDENSFTDQSERTLAAELIREQILHYIHREIPHGTAVKIDSFEESFTPVNHRSAAKGEDSVSTDFSDLSAEERDRVKIEATIYVEKDSHKGILIGKGGQSLKRIGSSARIQIEQMLGCKVRLELFVKVRKDWQNKDSILADLNYEPLQL